MNISGVSFIPLLCATSRIGHRRFYVIFMRLKFSIQRERTFNALHMGTGQQMSISSNSYFMSELKCLTHPSRRLEQSVQDKIYLSPHEKHHMNSPNKFCKRDVSCLTS